VEHRSCSDVDAGRWMAAVSTSTLAADIGTHISPTFRVCPILNLEEFIGGESKT
jgi:hypothetical protein